MGKSLVIREIQNWFYIKSTINKEKKNPSSKWHEYKLRSNWYGRIYTVISLREEDMGEEEMVRNWRAMEKMRPINDYLVTLDFTELVFPSIEQVPNSQSYLVVYSPIFNKFTTRRAILYLSIFATAIGGLLIFAL